MQDLGQWVLTWANTPYATVALALLAFTESSFFPIPPDALLITLGLLQPQTALFLALVTTVGSVAGAALGYGIGRHGGRPLLLRLFGETQTARVQALYQHYDFWAIFIAAFTPIPFKIFTITAGVFALDMRRFLLASLLGRGARFFLVGITVMLFGGRVQYYLTNYFELTVTVLALLVIIGFLCTRVLMRRLLPKLPGPKADALLPPPS